MIRTGRNSSVCAVPAVSANSARAISPAVKASFTAGKNRKNFIPPISYETPCGLIMCITALVFEGETLGYITTGPVVLWEKDEFFMEEFRKNCMKVGFDYREKSFDPSSIRQIDCRSMTSVSETLTMLLNYMLQEEKKYIRQRLEISRLNIERLRAAKEMQIRQAQPRYNKYPIELEKELISYVQMGDKNQATLIINKFLNEIFSFASGDACMNSVISVEGVPG